MTYLHRDNTLLSLRCAVLWFHAVLFDIPPNSLRSQLAAVTQRSLHT